MLATTSRALRRRRVTPTFSAPTLVASLLAVSTQLVFVGQVAAAIDIPAEGVSVPMLDLGGRPVVEVSVGPVTPMFGKVNKPPRGVLSALSFSGHLVTFDYPRKQIVLRKGALAEPNGKTIFFYGADEMLPTVPVKVAGREIKVHLDTGAPFALALPTKYKDEVALTAPAEEKGKARAHSGLFPIFKGTVKGEIAIGAYKLVSREVAFTDVVPHPGATPQGQVGYAALRDFTVTLDSANRRIEFAKGAEGAAISH